MVQQRLYHACGSLGERQSDRSAGDGVEEDGVSPTSTPDWVMLAPALSAGYASVPFNKNDARVMGEVSTPPGPNSCMHTIV